MTSREIGAGLEQIGREIVQLRERARALGERLHEQASRPGGVVVDEIAWTAYCALYDVGRPLYSRGHALKRLGLKIQREVKS